MSQIINIFAKAMHEAEQDSEAKELRSLTFIQDEALVDVARLGVAKYQAAHNINPFLYPQAEGLEVEELSAEDERVLRTDFGTMLQARAEAAWAASEED